MSDFEAFLVFYVIQPALFVFGVAVFVFGVAQYFWS